jgi:hypothetical protein
LAPRVAAAQRGGAQRHARLLQQIHEVAGHGATNELGPGDRTVDPRDLRRLDPQASASTAGAISARAARIQ